MPKDTHIHDTPCQTGGTESASCQKITDFFLFMPQYHFLLCGIYFYILDTPKKLIERKDSKISQ